MDNFPFEPAQPRPIAPGHEPRPLQRLPGRPPFTLEQQGNPPYDRHGALGLSSVSTPGSVVRTTDAFGGAGPGALARGVPLSNGGLLARLPLLDAQRACGATAVCHFPDPRTGQTASKACAHGVNGSAVCAFGAGEAQPACATGAADGAPLVCHFSAAHAAPVQSTPPHPSGV